MNNDFENGFIKIAKMTRKEKIDFIHKGNLYSLRNKGTKKDYAKLTGGGAAVGLGLGSGAALGASILNKYVGSGAKITKSLRELAPAVGKAGLATGTIGLGLAALRHLGKKKISNKKYFNSISDDNLSKGVEQIKAYYKRNGVTKY